MRQPRPGELSRLTAMQFFTTIKPPTDVPVGIKTDHRIFGETRGLLRLIGRRITLVGCTIPHVRPRDMNLNYVNTT